MQNPAGAGFGAPALSVAVGRLSATRRRATHVRPADRAGGAGLAGVPQASASAGSACAAGAAAATGSGSKRAVKKRRNLGS
ncbi:hypothetical protein MASR1M50_04180 [Burkholderiales bacterium]